MAVRFDFCWLLQRPAVRFFLLLVSSPILFRVSAVKRPPLFFFVGCCCCSCSPTHKAYSIYILTPFHFFFLFVVRSPRKISFASHWRNVHPHIPRRIAYVCTRQSQKRVEQNSSFHWFDLLLWFRPSAFASCPFRKRFKPKRNESEKRAVSSPACALIQSDVDDQDARSLAHSINFNNCDALLFFFFFPPHFPFGFVCSRHLFETSFQPYSTRLCLAARNEVVLFCVT